MILIACASKRSYRHQSAHRPRRSDALRHHGGDTAGLGGLSPYVLEDMRHSFAAWALTLRIDPNKLVRLMGHGSKKMVYEVGRALRGPIASTLILIMPLISFGPKS